MYNTNNWFSELPTTELIHSLMYPKNISVIEEIKTSSKDGIITAKYKVPGYNKDEIKIDIKPSNGFNVDRTLTINANNAEYGAVNYKSYIPKNIDEKLTKANLKNGILTLTFVQEKIKSPLANLKIEVE
jgi:HSP20 family molecular chaperone IbpA